MIHSHNLCFPSKHRELATQTHAVLEHFLKNLTEIKLKSILLVSGSDTETDLQRYRSFGGNIVIATPGKLEYILQHREFRVNMLEVLVMDEADR